MRVLARLTNAKLQQLACTCTVHVARDFGMRTRDSEHTQHMRDAYHTDSRQAKNYCD